MTPDEPEKRISTRLRVQLRELRAAAESGDGDVRYMEARRFWEQTFDTMVATTMHVVAQSYLNRHQAPPSLAAVKYEHEQILLDAERSADQALEAWLARFG